MLEGLQLSIRKKKKLLRLVNRETGCQQDKIIHLQYNILFSYANLPYKPCQKLKINLSLKIRKLNLKKIKFHE